MKSLTDAIAQLSTQFNVFAQKYTQNSEPHIHTINKQQNLLIVVENIKPTKKFISSLIYCIIDVLSVSNLTMSISDNQAWFDVIIDKSLIDTDN